MKLPEWAKAKIGNGFGSGYNNIELDMVTMATIERHKLRNKQELL